LVSEREIPQYHQVQIIHVSKVTHAFCFLRIETDRVKGWQSNLASISPSGFLSFALIYVCSFVSSHLIVLALASAFCIAHLCKTLPVARSLARSHTHVLREVENNLPPTPGFAHLRVATQDTKIDRKRKDAFAPTFLCFACRKKKDCKYERTTYKKKIEQETKSNGKRAGSRAPWSRTVSLAG